MTTTEYRVRANDFADEEVEHIETPEQKLERVVNDFTKALAQLPHGDYSTLRNLAACQHPEAGEYDAPWLRNNQAASFDSRNDISSAWRRASDGLDYATKHELASTITEWATKPLDHQIDRVVNEHFERTDAVVHPASHSAIRDAVTAVAQSHALENKAEFYGGLLHNNHLQQPYDDYSDVTRVSRYLAQYATSDAMERAYEVTPTDSEYPILKAVYERADALLDQFSQQSVHHKPPEGAEPSTVKLDDFRENPALILEFEQFKRQLSAAEAELLDRRIAAEHANDGHMDDPRYANIESLDQQMFEYRGLRIDAEHQFDAMGVNDFRAALAEHEHQFLRDLSDFLDNDKHLEHYYAYDTDLELHLTLETWRTDGREICDAIITAYTAATELSTDATTEAVAENIRNALQQAVNYQAAQAAGPEAAHDNLERLLQQDYHIVNPQGWTNLHQSAQERLLLPDDDHQTDFGLAILDKDAEYLHRAISLQFEQIAQWQNIAGQGLPESHRDDYRQVVDPELSWTRGQEILADFQESIEHDPAQPNVSWQQMIQDPELFRKLDDYLNSLPPGDAARLSGALAGVSRPDTD